MTTLFLTAQQVAARLGVSTDTVWRWRKNGDLPEPVKLGPNVTRWRLADLEAWESQLRTCFAFECYGGKARGLRYIART